MAEAKLGRRESALARLLAILSLAGPAGQLSEVAEPHSLTMLGNYPQVQSHAALVEAVLQLWGPAHDP
jgi:GH15 family glucan-1,4-alpha-glucosidase